ncbi:MAG TPA: metal ABC transporter permease [Candidatus Paceibacterota bacterium]|nr:metal ABC transporter permease [Candidatus Paceibacterota bacterium]
MPLSQLSLSLVTAFFIGGIAGFLGSLMITRRMALVSGPLGHLALPGVALGLVYSFDIFWGALATIAIGSFFIWLLTLRGGRLPVEALTAVVFSSTVALGFLILPIEEAERALIGDITTVTPFDALLAIVLSIVLFIIIRRIYLRSVLLGISTELALSRGINARKYNFIFLVGIALVVAMEVKIVGILLTAALMAIPAAAASNFSRSMTQYRNLGLLFGGASAVMGVCIAEATGLAAGPLIILTGTVLFLASLLFAER